MRDRTSPEEEGLAIASSDHIKIDPTQSAATEANELLAFIRAVRQAYELGERIRDKMRHNFDDSGGSGSINWTQVQTLWGIASNGTVVGTSSNGQIIFTYVDGATGSLDGTFQTNAGKEMSERVG